MRIVNGLGTSQAAAMRNVAAEEHALAQHNPRQGRGAQDEDFGYDMQYAETVVDEEEQGFENESLFDGMSSSSPSILDGVCVDFPCRPSGGGENEWC